MNNISEDTILFEHRFWLQIMGDHARFIFFSLAPSESEFILTAQKFIIMLDDLLKQAQEESLSQEELLQLNQNAYNAILQFREFKLELLRMSIMSDLKTHLPPTFFNDMLNELEEYLLIITAYMNEQSLIFHPLHYHIIWLTDAIGHAATLSSTLDPIEKVLINKSNNYEIEFNNLFMKSYIMNGYLRTQQRNFPSLESLNKEASLAVNDFMEFLDNLRDQRIDLRILGTLMPLMADHMSREECYYLWKLSQTTDNIRKPDCSPIKPRIEA